MKTKVLSKSEASYFHSDAPWACISIASVENTWPEIDDKNRLGILRLNFWDTNHITEKSFTEEHASQILDFVDKFWDDIDLLMVHCEAGISRSSGVASAIELIKNGRGADNYYFDQNTHYIPNTLVYKTLLNLFIERGGEVSDENLNAHKKEIIHNEPWDCNE